MLVDESAWRGYFRSMSCVTVSLLQRSSFDPFFLYPGPHQPGNRNLSQFLCRPRFGSILVWAQPAPKVAGISDQLYRV